MLFFKLFPFGKIIRGSPIFKNISLSKEIKVIKGIFFISEIFLYYHTYNHINSTFMYIMEI